MALEALPFDLVWSSCRDSHIMSYTPTSKVLLFFSIPSTSKKKKKKIAEAGLYLVHPRGSWSRMLQL